MRRTEALNPRSRGIDCKPVEEILKIINEEDSRIANLVAFQIDSISEAVEALINAIQKGGRVFFVGAGTSGRLGLLEAAELPPTFGVEHHRFIPIIAGGREAVFRSKEGLEDSVRDGQLALQGHQPGGEDLVIATSASGSTPFVLGAIELAREAGSTTVGISCNRESPLKDAVDVAITIETGAEVVAGSTRMKAGTAQKMVLNMITTASMIKLGRVHDGYMVGLQTTSNKLKDRAKRSISEITKLDLESASELLERAEGDVRVAILSELTDITPKDAKSILGKWTPIRSLIEATSCDK